MDFKWGRLFDVIDDPFEMPSMQRNRREITEIQSICSLHPDSDGVRIKEHVLWISEENFI